jgi:hypothetical protein
MPFWCLLDEPHIEKRVPVISLNKIGKQNFCAFIIIAHCKLFTCTKSIHFIIFCGLQGSALSPFSYSFYITQADRILPVRCSMLQYAWRLTRITCGVRYKTSLGRTRALHLSRNTVNE